jgi:CheY-like chemotaxis protein
MKNNNKTHKILLIDDDQDDRLLFEAALRKVTLNVDFTSVEGGKEAIETLKGMKGSLPDLMFVDLNMPDIDGFACIKQMRQNPDWDAVPIIILSTSHNPFHIEMAKGTGADGYFKKPNDFNDLCSTLENLLKLKTGRQKEFVYHP